jgi:hypothetical protein
VINQIHGKTSKGESVSGDRVPGFFLMNFIGVNSAEKLPGSSGTVMSPVAF